MLRMTNFLVYDCMSPFSMTLLMNGVWWLYGMKVRSGSGTVTMRLASFPAVTDPTVRLMPMAYALLSVQALNASSGVSLICMQPRAITKRMSPLGDEPGL